MSELPTMYHTVANRLSDMAHAVRSHWGDLESRIEEVDAEVLQYASCVLRKLAEAEQALQDDPVERSVAEHD
jgi:phosphate uptake regulator